VRYLAGMRTILALALLAPALPLLLVPVGCGGGGDASGGAKVPDNPIGVSGAATGAPDATAAGSAGASGPTTTTTTTLGAGGDLQGSKLSSTTTVASTTGSAAPPAKGPHTHEIGRGPADLRAIMAAHRDEARACYDAALPSHPGVQGDLVIQFTIDPKGNVTQVSQDTERSQITEPTIVGCVVNVIKKIQFATSPGGYETKAFFPFNFQPRHTTTPPPG
jgi:hypothetical protein